MSAKAKEIALDRAGVKESHTRYLTVKKDYDDGIKIYEVEFQVGELEYSAEINAKTGKLLDYEIESIWD